MNAFELSSLTSMLYAIRAAKNAHGGLLHAYSLFRHASGKKSDKVRATWDKKDAVLEIRSYRMMVERMIGWDVSEGMLNKL